MTRRIGSDLNLDGLTAPRSQPGSLPYGPTDVPATSAKRLQRATIWARFATALSSLLVLAVLLYMALQG